ncbi:hypothetical protein PVAG01_04026 [Phlyctema vagabunda]|uniref:Uncharacterized protein n=1 Tax=Phlyctema vagabunda TaxID=108571 RepID=A0ABR4PN77_9HELO
MAGSFESMPPEVTNHIIAEACNQPTVIRAGFDETSPGLLFTAVRQKLAVQKVSKYFAKEAGRHLIRVGYKTWVNPSCDIFFLEIDDINDMGLYTLLERRWLREKICGMTAQALAKMTLPCTSIIEVHGTSTPCLLTWKPDTELAPTQKKLLHERRQIPQIFDKITKVALYLHWRDDLVDLGLDDGPLLYDISEDGLTKTETQVARDLESAVFLYLNQKIENALVFFPKLTNLYFVLHEPRRQKPHPRTGLIHWQFVPASDFTEKKRLYNRNICQFMEEKLEVWFQNKHELKILPRIPVVNLMFNAQQSERGKI